jgi:hypothetical protein
MGTRTYPSGSFRLMFDKESATLGGFTEAGGLMTTVWTPATLSALNKVLVDAINFGRALKSMRILSVAFDGKVVQIREVSAPRFLKFIFDSVGATLNVPATLDVVASGISKIVPGDGTIVSVAGLGIVLGPQWMRCHYRLELGPLPTQKVTAIGAITIAVPNAAQSFVISVQPIDAPAYRQALKANLALNATVKYLAPSLATVCSVSFPQARLTQEIPTNSVGPAQFEIAPGRATFSYGS